MLVPAMRKQLKASCCSPFSIHCVPSVIQTTDVIAQEPHHTNVLPFMCVMGKKNFASVSAAHESGLFWQNTQISEILSGLKKQRREDMLLGVWRV